jgi:hypothetical protein
MQKFLPNPDFERQLGNDPLYVAWLKSVADEAAESAKSLAQSDAYETGQYMGHITGDVVSEGGKKFARLNAWSFKAHWIEFGTRKMGARHILKRAVEAMGLAVRDE